MCLIWALVSHLTSRLDYIYTVVTVIVNLYIVAMQFLQGPHAGIFRCSERWWGSICFGLVLQMVGVISTRLCTIKFSYRLFLDCRRHLETDSKIYCLFFFWRAFVVTLDPNHIKVCCASFHAKQMALLNNPWILLCHLLLVV